MYIFIYTYPSCIGCGFKKFETIYEEDLSYLLKTSNYI